MKTYVLGLAKVKKAVLAEEAGIVTIQKANALENAETVKKAKANPNA